MKPALPVGLAALLVPALVLAAPAFTHAASAAAGSASATVATCSDAPSRTLADVGNALTSGPDAAVLKAALNDHTRLLACGDTRQAISTELIAADAYGDVNEPKKRCDALRDARAESLKIGDAPRAKMIEKSLRSC